MHTYSALVIYNVIYELYCVYTESSEVTITLCAAGSSSHPAIRAQLPRQVVRVHP